MMCPLSSDCKQMITYKVFYFSEPNTPFGLFGSIFCTLPFTGQVFDGYGRCIFDCAVIELAFERNRGILE